MTNNLPCCRKNGNRSIEECYIEYIQWREAFPYDFSMKLELYQLWINMYDNFKNPN